MGLHLSSCRLRLALLPRSHLGWEGRTCLRSSWRSTGVDVNGRTASMIMSHDWEIDAGSGPLVGDEPEVEVDLRAEMSWVVFALHSCDVTHDTAPLDF